MNVNFSYLCHIVANDGKNVLHVKRKPTIAGITKWERISKTRTPSAEVHVLSLMEYEKCYPLRFPGTRKDHQPNIRDQGDPSCLDYINCGEEWDSSRLIAQDTLCMNEYLSRFEPRYREKKDPHLRRAETTRPHPGIRMVRKLWVNKTCMQITAV